MKLILSFLIISLLSEVEAWEDTCQPFHEIYTDGKDLCETIFGDAFVYETNESKAYTMWWFEAGNVNDATTLALNKTVPAECELQYFHKSGAPTAEGDDFTECHPYKDSSCCYDATVTTPTTMNEAYGPGYEWDRCGTMSQACERFFVQEACLYECDVNAGLYRKCTDAQVAAAGDDTSDPCAYNTWEMYRMPIKASYCDAWYEACFNDQFCGGSDGNFFSCAAYYSASQATPSPVFAPTPAPTTVKSDKKKVVKELPIWAQVCIGILCAVVALAAFAFCLTVRRERAGNPLFKPLNQDMTKNPEAYQADDQGGDTDQDMKKAYEMKKRMEM